MTIALKKNVPGFRDANGVFRPIRSASYVGGGSSRRKATAKDRKKYSRAKAGDLGKAKQERALEAPWDRDARLEREAKAAEKREQDRITRELEREIYGETSGRTSRGKGRSLAQFIRSEGGINTRSKVRKGRVRYGDSLENFTRKGSGSTGLVTTTPGKGKSLDYMHQAAREAGYDVASMDDLLDALDNEIRSGKKTYSTHGSMTYNPRKTVRKNSASTDAFREVAKVYGVVFEQVNRQLHNANGVQSSDLAKKYGPRHPDQAHGITRDIVVHGKKAPAFMKIAKPNPDLLGMFANAAVGIASTLQINEMIKSRKRTAAPKRRGTTTAKAKKSVVSGRSSVVSRKKKNPSQPNLFKRQPKGELYVLTIGSGDDLISVYLHDGDKDGFSKRFKTMAGAKSYATRNKVKLVENPKRNGIIKRAWARSRAASEYRRELRLEAAADRSRKRRSKFEGKARSNPVAKLFGKTFTQLVAVAKKVGKSEFGVPKSMIGDAHSYIAKHGGSTRNVGGRLMFRLDKANPARGSANYKKIFGLTATQIRNAHDISLALWNSISQAERNKLGREAAAWKKNPPRRSTNGKKAVARSAKANPKGRRMTSAEFRSLNDKAHPYRIIVGGKDTGGFSTLAKAREWVKRHEGTVKLTIPKKAPARRNPKSTARRRTFEMFQGRKVTTARPMLVSNHAPANLDALGDLVELKIAGGPTLKFNGKGTKLCAANGKLWIAGKRFAKANPSGKPNEINPIGEIDHVVYGTYKPHHGDHNYTHYIHKLGEESGKRPILCVDREGFPVIRGGNYKIEARGIVD